MELEKDLEEIMEYFIQDIDVLINDIINMSEYTATRIVSVKQPLILKIYSFLNDYKKLQKENQELLEVKISASANNRIMELEKENQSYRDYYGTPPCYDNAKYIPKSKVKEKIEELHNELEEKYSAEKISIFSGNTYMEKFKLLGKVQVLQELLEDK